MPANRIYIYFIFLIASCTSFAWDGPPPPIGGLLSNLATPSDYVDLSATGFWNGTTPFDDRLRTNFVVTQSAVDTFQLSTHLEETDFQSSTNLGGAGITVPTNLYDVDLGLTYSHKLENKRDDWGLIASLGSDSDVPFNSINEFDFQLTATYHYVVDDLHSWFFLINYSLSRPFLPGIPLPGLGYVTINPAAHTVLVLGVPLIFSWQFDPKWNVSVTYLLPFTINADLDYRLTTQAKAFLNFQWFTQSWFRAFRANDLNRIIFDQKRVTAGVSTGLGSDYFTSIFAGFAFDQQLYEAQSQSLSPSSQFLPVNLLGQIELAKRF